jgi:hypothetical protein
MTDEQLLAIQLERLRAILIQLEGVRRAGERYDELLERARVLVAEVRAMRAQLYGETRSPHPGTIH